MHICYELFLRSVRLISVGHAIIIHLAVLEALSSYKLVIIEMIQRSKPSFPAQNPTV